MSIQQTLDSGASATQEETLEIPPNVLVACPITGGRVVRMERCPGCDHFAGLADRFGEGSPQPFAVRYMLRCRYPTTRQLVELDEENAA